MRTIPVQWTCDVCHTVAIATVAIKYAGSGSWGAELYEFKRDERPSGWKLVGDFGTVCSRECHAIFYDTYTNRSQK